MGKGQLGEFLAWMFRRRERFNVRGLSMEPILQENQDVLLQRYTNQSAVQEGDIVVLHDPREHQRLLIKQVTAITESGIVVHGTNKKHSTDSRVFGPVLFELIKGKVTVVF